MSKCSNKANPVPLCTTTLEVGELPSANTDYDVVFEEVATGRRARLDGSTDGNKTLTVTLSGVNWSTTSYILKVIPDGGDNIHDTQTITISGTGYTCLEFEFVPVTDSNGDLITYSTHKIDI